jgi:hypothetical protein
MSLDPFSAAAEAISAVPVVRVTEHMTSLQMVEGARSGRIFTVEFIKRTNGALRRMTCRRGVRKGVKGVGMSYDPLSKGLLPVYDVEKQAFRMINLSDLVSLKMGRRTFVWNGKRFERLGDEIGPL